MKKSAKNVYNNEDLKFTQTFIIFFNLFVICKANWDILVSLLSINVKNCVF